MKNYLKAIGAFLREFDEMTEHARTGRRPTRRNQRPSDMPERR